MGLWQQLSVGMERDTRVATRTALAEHGQRLAFATALRNMHNEHQELVDAAIRYRDKNLMYCVLSHLTPSSLGLFYIYSAHYSEIHLGIETVQTLAINLLTSIDPSKCQENNLITPKTHGKDVPQYILKRLK